jgi:nucleoside 2-deoxyribosyltransferase
MNRDPIKLRIYLAGTGHDPRFHTTDFVDKFREAGFDVVSHWHDPGVWKPEGLLSVSDEFQVAERNFRDLEKADVVVVVVPEDYHHLRGAHVECGYAIAKGMKIVVWGHAHEVNTMTRVDNCKYIKVWSALIAHLKMYEVELNHVP